jgi:O-antigen ligase
LIVYFSLAGAINAGTQLQIGIDEWGSENSRRAVTGHNQNFTSYALSGVILLALVSSSLIRFPAWFKLALPATILALIYIQVLLGTRGALISSVAVIALYLSRNSSLRLIFPLIPAIALSFSILVSFGFTDSLFSYIESFSSRDTGDLSKRTEIWAEAILYIAKFPFLGIGPGSFQSVNSSGHGAHNFFLLILLESGLLGAVILTIFFVSFARLFFRMGNRRLGGYLICIFSAYWFPLVSSGHWETSPFSWIVLGVFACLAHTSVPDKDA